MGTILDDILNQKGDNPNNKSNNTSNNQNTILSDVLNYNQKNNNNHATDVQLGQYGVGESKYDIGVTPTNVDQLSEIRAQQQSSIAKLGSGLGNAIVQTGLDVLKDTSYLLDYENYTDFKKSSEEGFNNWLAESLNKVEDKLKLPVYRTEASKGFSPTSAGWWGENLPSILSTVSMMIPAEGAVVGLSKIGRALGGNKLIKGIENISGATGLSDKLEGVTGAILSRQMENIMEGSQTFQDTKQKALDSGRSEEESNRIAGEAAANNYKLNWINLTTDLPQYMLLHKSFKQSLKDQQFKFTDLLKTAISEGAEEGYQFISNEESKRAALINNKVQVDDKSDITDRLGNYSKEGDFWTSVFLGGLGGSIFGGVASYKSARNLPKLQEQYESLAKLHDSIIKNDEESFNRTSDELFNNELISHIKDGTLDDFKNILKETQSVPEDSKDKLDTQKSIKERNDIIDFSEQYKDQLSADNTKSPELKAVELATAINEKLTSKRLNNISQNINNVQSEDISSLNLTDPTLYQFKLSKLKYEAIKDIPEFKQQTSELLNNINDNYKMLLSEGTFKSKEDIDKHLTSSNDSKLITLLKNQEIDSKNLKEIKSVLYNISTEDGKKTYQDYINKIKEDLKKQTEKEEKVKQEEAEKSEEKPIVETDAKIAESKIDLSEKLIKAFDTDNIEEFEPLYKDILKHPQLSVEDKLGLVHKYSQLREKVASNLTSLDDLIEKAKTPEDDEDPDQNSISDFISNNTTANTTDQDQSVLDNTDNIISNIDNSEKSINLRDNVVMMHLFNHYFKDGRFIFTRDEEGYPQLDNNSNLDIDELNRIQKGDKVVINYVNLTKTQEESYSKLKDYDGKHLGIYSNSKLVGFVQQPHIANDSDISKKIREDLITYRKYVINKLNKSEIVEEAINDKNNGNLYTKLNPNGRIDPINNILESPRTKDLVNGLPVFAYSDGEFIKIKSLRATNIQKKELEDALSGFPRSYGKKGQVFQVVKDLKDSWSVIPIYTNLINDITAEKIVQSLSNYKDNSDIKRIIIDLNKFIYSSRSKKGANLLINNTNGPIEIKVNGNNYTLKDINSNPIQRSRFIEDLKTQRQNISIDLINSKDEQKSLLERNTLVTNVIPFKDEYFVQPYIEYTHSNIQNSNIIEDTESLPTFGDGNLNQKNTDVKSANIEEDLLKKLDNEFGDIEPLNDENALSRSKEISKLDRRTINKWLQSNLPQLNISDINNITDLRLNITDSIGAFKDSTIYLFDGASNKTAYHEAFHGVFRNMLSKYQKYDILNEVISKYDSPTKEDLDFLQEGLNKLYTDKQLSYLYYEEKLADDFAEFTDAYNNRTWSQKITDFFNKILEYFRLFTKNNQNKIDELFHNINTKKFASKSTKSTKSNSVDIVNRPFEEFNTEYAYSRDLDKIFGTQGKVNLITNIGNQFLSIYQNESNQGKITRPLFIYESIRSKYVDFLKKALENKDLYTKKDIDYARQVLINFPKLVNETEKYLAHRGIIINENILDNEDGFTEDNLGDSEFSVNTLRSQTTKGLDEWTSVSGLSSASTRLKLFLSSIPILDSNKSVKKDMYNMEQFHDFTKLYYYIERNLVGLYNLEDQIDRLKELSINRSELLQVVDKLTVKNSNIKDEEFKALQNDFKTNFSKQQLAYTLVKFDTDSNTGRVTYKIIDSNRQNLFTEVSNEWKTNLINIDKDTISEINPENDEIITFGTKKSIDLNDQWKALNKANNLTYDKVNNILSKIGIEYTPDVLKELLDSKNTIFKSSLTTILESYINPKFSGDSQTVRQVFNNLVQFEVNGTYNNYSSSFNNVEGKNIYTVQLPSYASKILAKLKSDNPIIFDNIIESFRKDPFYKNSNLLNELNSDENFRTNIFSLSYLDGLKDERGESKGSKFTDMTPKDYFSMQIALFQNTAINKQKELSNKVSKYIYITPSDKSMSMIFDAKQYDLTLEDNGREITFGSEILGKFYNIFLQEANRIKHNLTIKEDIVNKKNDSKYQLNKLLEHYHVSKKNYSTLTKYVLKQSNNESIDDSEWKEISGLFDGQSFKFNQFSQKSNNTLLKVLEDINDLDKITESQKDTILTLIRQDLTEEIKRVKNEMRSKALIELKDNLIVPISIEIEGINKEQININSEKLIASYALNSWLHNIEISNILNGDVALYKPADLQKRTYQSQSFITNNNFISKTIKTIVVKDIMSSSDSAMSIREMLENQGLEKDLIDSIVNPYIDNQINVTDAQVYISPEFYKNIHLSRGIWSNEMQKAFDIVEGKEKPSNINKELRVLLGGIKPFYFGNRFDENLGIQKYEQVKCAMLPLFKAYTDINPLLKAKRDNMEVNGVDMLAHESSFKATIGFRDSIINDNGVILDLDTDNFGIQVDNPEHILDSENDSMRQLKMLLIGSIDTNKTYKGINGKTIRDEILSMEATNIRESLSDLRTKLDIKSNLEFSKFIKEAVTKRGSTINVEELLNIIDGDFEFPLDNGTLSTQIENMISSIFTNNVIKQSFSVGGSGVQASSLGLKFKDLQEQQDNLPEDLKLIQQELKWIKPNEDKSTIEYAEAVMPAWSQKFFNKEGFLNDIDSIPEELRQLVMYRIPTEGLHSMLPIKVIKFLPETMGNFILLPYEVTTQLGADFDFDKIYFIGREFYKDIKTKEYKVYTSSEDINERYNQYKIYNKINHTKELSFEEFEKLPIERQLTRSARNNKIIDNYLHLLTSPENLKLLVTKSGFDELVNIKKTYFENYTKSSFFSTITQRDYKDRNHTGIALKGQWALHVSGHSYSTLMNLNSARYLKNGNLDILSSINFNNNNKTNFSGLYTDNNSLISDKIASVMAGVLDDIKDPLLNILGINKHTTDVGAIIIRSGYNLETAIKFIAQPGIKELSKLLDSNSNKIKSIGQIWENTDNLIESYNKLMYEAFDKLDDSIKESDDLSSLMNLSENPTSNIDDNELEEVLLQFKRDSLKDLNNEELIKYYAFQIRVLKNFNNIKVIADSLVDINKFFGINKEVGPNIEDIVTKSELLNNIQESEIIKGFDLSKIPTLQASWETHKEATNFFENYFPYTTEYYDNIKKSLLNKQTNKDITKIPTEDRSNINSFIRYYTDNKFDKFSEISNNYGKLFVYLPNLISKVKKAGTDKELDTKFGNITFKDLKKNLFINSLKISYDKKTRKSYITLKGGKLDLQVKNNLIESFTTLYNNQNSKQLALDLIEYSFVSTGFYTGLSSYSSLISPSILKELGYMGYRKKLIFDLTNDNINLDSIDNNRIIDQFIRNFPKTFTKVFDSEMFANVDPKKPLPDSIYTSEEMIDLFGRKQDIVLDIINEAKNIKVANYIRVYDKVAKKALLYHSELGEPIYNRINYLGKKGYMIEVNPYKDIQESFLNENNMSKPKDITKNQDTQLVSLEDIINQVEDQIPNITENTDFSNLAERITEQQIDDAVTKSESLDKDINDTEDHEPLVSMSCRQNYIDKIRKDILDLYGVDRTSASLIKPNKILLPVNDNHPTKESTNEWANRIKTELDTKYNSKFYGSQVAIDNNSNSNGTIVDITIQKALIDGYERKYGTQTNLFQLDSVNKKNDLLSNIYKGLEEYIKINNINIEFLENLKEDNNLDPISIFNIIDNTIKINQNKQDNTTLPEELGHHITTALGNDDILVNRALNLIKRLNYRKELGESYIIAYNNDDLMLRKEYLGKLISKTIVNKFENPIDSSENGIKLFDTIKRLINKFISLFKPNDNIMSELQKDIDELSSMILSGKKINRSIDINDTKFYQLNDKINEIPKEYQKQYIYFKKLINSNKSKLSKLDIIKDSDKISKLNESIITTQKALDELLASKNKKLLIELSNSILDDVEKYIGELEINKDNKNYYINNIDHTINTLNVFKQFEGTSDKSIKLYNRIVPFIRVYAIQEANNYSTNSIGEEEIFNKPKDIFVGDKNFGTLSDIKNYLGKTIGEIIKDAQSRISIANKESYNNLNKEIEKLKNYYKKQGIKGDKIYNIFIQKYSGTTVLTKEYTSEFYDLINSIYNDSKLTKFQANAKVKLIASWNGKKWIPRDSIYNNANYKIISQTKELKEFYDYFKNIISKISDELPNRNLNSNFIPNVVEQSLLDILKSDKSLMGKLKEVVENITDIHPIEDNLTGNTINENLFPDEIPLKYIQSISADKKSKDLGSSLLKFMYFANSYKEMSEVLPKTRLLQEIIKSTEFIKNTNDKITISGEKSNVNQMVEKFIEMQVLGKTKNEEKLGNFQYDKIIDFGLKYTSLLRIGLSPTNAISNVFIGNIGNFVESMGGRFFNWSEYTKARGIYFNEVFNDKSKLHKIVDILNPLMELEDYTNLEKIDIDNGKTINRDKIKSILYAPQKMGENYLQISTMIANLLHDKIQIKDGSKISIWEAFKEDGTWDESRVGIPLTDKMVYNMTRKVQRINQMIHGRYSAKDAAIVTQGVIWRAAFQFKKWIPAAIESRFASKKFDDKLGENTEGRYRTYLKGWNLMLAKLTSDAEKLEKYKFNETDLYNMRKNMTEVTILVGTLLGFWGLGGMGDDDKDLKKQGLYKFSMQQLDRVSSDLLFFMDPAEANRNLNQGLPLLKTIRDLSNAVINIPYIFGIEDIGYLTDKEYKKGQRADENKGIASLLDIIPIVHPITDVIRDFKKEPYQTPINR